MAFLIHLSKAFAGMGGIVTAFAVIQGYAVLNAIPPGPNGRAVTIGCRYGQDGGWWLYDVHTGESIWPANDASGAAKEIRYKMEGVARA